MMKIKGRFLWECIAILLLLIFLEQVACAAQFKLPNHLEAVEEEAFAGTKLSGLVELPRNVDRIGDRAFADTDIYALDFSSTNMQEVGSRLFGDREVAYAYMGLQIECDLADDALCGAKMVIADYRWENYADNIGSRLIDYKKIKKCDGFYYEVVNGFATLLCAVDARTIPAKVALPEEVDGSPLTCISNLAFFGCPQVRRITLPYSVKKIEAGAFDGVPDAMVQYNNTFGITQQPNSVFALEDDWVTLGIKANASNYQWQYYDGDWKDVSYEGQGTDTLRFQFSASLINETKSWGDKTHGLWRCVVSDALGNTATSQTVCVAEKPHFIREPEDRPGNPGDSVEFSAQVGGTYKSWFWEYLEDGGSTWTKLSVASGETDSISVFVTTSNRNRVYRAIAVDAAGGQYPSREVRVRASGDVVIRTQPQDQSAFVGSDFTFSLKADYATGYQWQISLDNGASWENIGTATADTLTLTAEDSHYESAFRCVVTGYSGQTLSNVVRLHQPDDRIQQTDPSSVVWTTSSSDIIEKGVPLNGTVTLSGYCASSGWTFSVYDILAVEDDGVTVTDADGETSRVLEIVKSSQTSDGSNHIAITLKGKRVGRAMLKGVNEDNVFTCMVEVYGPKPVIIKQPQDQLGNLDDMVQFEVDAIGSRGYAWKTTGNNTDILCEDKVYPMIIESESMLRGNTIYICRIIGDDGSINYSDSATIYPPPSCDIEVDNQCPSVGDTVVLHCMGFDCYRLVLETNRRGEWMDWSSRGNYSGSHLDYYYNALDFTSNWSVSKTDFYNREWRVKAVGRTGQVAYSETIHVSESQPVTIVKQPEDQYASLGETVHFDIEVENAASYWWQFSDDGGQNWYYMGYNDTKEDKPTLYVTPHMSEYDGAMIWRCKVTGVSGYELPSNTVMVKRPSFGLVKQPENQYVSVGETATFSVQATGATYYQWQSRSGTGSWKDISGGTGASLNVTATTSILSSDMEYRCVVKGSESQVITSQTAKLIEKLVITMQPSDIMLSVGGRATFTVTASGAKSYQWVVSQDGGNTWKAATASGAKTATLSFTVEKVHFEQLWRCDIVNGDQSLSSRAVRINALLRITGQPVDVEAQIGSAAVFEIAAENATAYQWQVSADGGASWANASGTSGKATYSYTVSAQSDYEKRWRCVVSNLSGEQLYSEMVRVIEPSVIPVISIQPQSCYAKSGSTAVFAVTASGVQLYQWQISRDGGATWSASSGTGAQSHSLSVSVTETLWSTAQWRCLLTGSGGATAVTEAVSVYEPLAIAAQPVDAEGRVGYTTTFSLRANGAVRYEWQVSNDSGINWNACSDAFEANQALDVPVEAAHFEGYRWRCLVFGPLGDHLTSDMVRVIRAQVPVTKVTLDVSNFVILPNTTRQIQVFIEPRDATDQSITWLSADAKVATVDANGLVTAVAQGTTSIRATVGGLEASCLVTVADDFTVEFPDFVDKTWTDDVHYQGLTVKLSGAVMPCTVSASIVDKTGEAYRTSGSVPLQQSEWEWATGAFTKTGVYNAVITATDAAGRTVTARTGDITVQRKPVYRALLIYQRDWANGNERHWFEYDATALKTLLDQNSYEGGAKYEISISANQSKSGIQSKIKSTFKGVQDGDVSFVWVSCHGISSTYTGKKKVLEGALWVPAASNEKTMNAHNFYTSDASGNISCNYHILASEFAGWLKSSIPKGNIFVGFSSCGSGSYVYKNGYISEVRAAGSDSDTADSLISAIRAIEASQSRTGELMKPRFNVLTGAAYHEYGWGVTDFGTFLPSWIGDGAGTHRPLYEGPTVFRRTEMLADYDGDGNVTIAEIYKYVRAEADKHNGVCGNPKGYWTDSSFVLFHYDN